jgi:hypothetical protein
VPNLLTDTSPGELTRGRESGYGGPVKRAVHLAIGVAAVILLSSGILLYRSMDRGGWVSHTRDTDMYVGMGGWAPGEERKCSALPAQDGDIIFLGCVVGPESFLQSQTLSVKYWGKIKRPDRFLALTENPRMEGWTWRCTKKRSSVTCWAVN